MSKPIPTLPGNSPVNRSTQDGFSQALLEDCMDLLPEESRHHLRRLRSSSQRMAQLIDDLLSLSRVYRQEMRCRPVDLSGLARRIAAELNEEAPDRSVRIEIEPYLQCNGDSHLLRIGLHNLLQNSFKFTAKKAEARIQVGSQVNDGRTVFFVRDNGAGFDMQYADKLFRPFQRLHALAEFEGTGIGLALVARVVRRHGGDVWAEAAVDQGATIFFTLAEVEGE